MSVSNSLFITLYGRKAKNNQTSIYINIRVKDIGQKRITTGLSVPNASFRDGRIVGRTSSSLNTEKILRTIYDKIESAYLMVLQEKMKPAPDLIVSFMDRVDSDQKTILSMMNMIVDQKEDAFKTGQASKHLPQKFRALRENVKDFIKDVYGKADIFLYEANLDFVSKFAVYLMKMVSPNGNVTINKKISNLGQVFVYAVQNNWMQSNPTNQWKSLPEPKTNTEYLTEIQLLKFMEFKIPNDTHEIVKDTFLFMCFTGMGFSEMQRFSLSQIKEIEGESIIEYERSKAKIKKTIQIPLLPMAMELITKHYMKPVIKGRRSIVDKGPKDPVFSVQGMKIYNEKIKHLFSFNEMDLIFVVSSHAARKTFGNLMTKKLGLTDASQLLGHSEIKTTTKNYVDNASNDLLMQRLLKMRNIFNKDSDNN